MVSRDAQFMLFGDSLHPGPEKREGGGDFNLRRH